MAYRSRRTGWIWLVVAAIAGGAGACETREPPVEPVATPYKHLISYAEARAVLDAHRDRLPADLAGKTPAELESSWPRWADAHDAKTRARLARGDEDSIVNFWMFGTSFTSRPRATAVDLAPRGGRAVAAEVLLGRLDDLIAAVSSPVSNERLSFVRDALQQRGLDFTTAAGRERARAYLIDAHERILAENEGYRRSAESAGQIPDEGARLARFASVYSDRGLSSDTSLPIDFALDETLSAGKSQRHLAAPVRRVAVIGPGLDFTDKADGHDFYPVQTIQPFALVDTLVRLGLATVEDLRVTAFDLSPRVTRHIQEAGVRAERGTAYTLQLPIVTNDPAHHWEPGFMSYWKRCGGAIGDAAAGLAPPGGAAGVDVRAVTVRPTVVLTITARDLNVVVERPSRLEDADRFDLIVATNVLVYYDPFQQALALANIASMLRPGGFFVTNYAMSPSAPMSSAAVFSTTTYWDRERHFDSLFWYQRK
jgi:SAM-dependent methyltransferase